MHPSQQKNEKKNNPETQELEDSTTDDYICDRCTNNGKTLFNVSVVRCGYVCSKCEKVLPEVIHHVRK